MNITELKGEKTVRELAQRLVEAAPAINQRKETAVETMEAALLRLNPHLNQIADLKAGTPVLVPRESAAASAAAPDDNPMKGLADEWLRRGELALERVRAALDDSVVQAKEQSERVQMWLKSDDAKAALSQNSEWKEIFQRSGVAAKNLPKEQAAFVDAETRSLSQVHLALKDFLGPAQENPASAAPAPRDAKS